MKSTAYRAYRTWATEPLTEDPVLSVVVYARNVEWQILSTIGAIATHVSSMGRPWELIVADDGSTDGTVGLLEALQFPNLAVLIARRDGCGGRAVSRGIQAARGDLVLLVDAGRPPPVAQVELLLGRLGSASYDIAFGCQAPVSADNGVRTVLPHPITPGFRSLVRAGFGAGARDALPGLVLYRTSAARQIFARARTWGCGSSLEVLYLANKLGLRVTEVPLRAGAGARPGARPTTMISHFLTDLARIGINDLTRRYEAVPPRWAGIQRSGVEVAGRRASPRGI